MHQTTMCIVRWKWIAIEVGCKRTKLCRSSSS